jgi:hypothetical protein
MVCSEKCMSESNKPAAPPPAVTLTDVGSGVTQLTEVEISDWRRLWREYAGHTAPALNHGEVFHNAWRALCSIHARLRGVSLAMPEPAASGIDPRRMCWFCFYGAAGRTIRFTLSNRLVPHLVADSSRHCPPHYVPACINCWQAELQSGHVGDLPVVLLPPEPRYLS